ncbi:bifunctional 4-hydroxy-2-oxoglutarate aldolase/2-dehydro-3-deoxy-phosphogluconate aldolase [Vibrio sp. DNB22_10_4]
MNTWTISASDVFSRSPIVPVMVIKRLEDAVPLARALKAGGIDVFEITLRTECALDAIKAISEAMPDSLVGAGTVINAQQYDAAVASGAKFVISPGATPSLLKHAAKGSAPLIPGAITPSEVMQALELGYDHLKFFPAEASGGAAVLKSIAAPLPQVKFCPTGGVSLSNLKQYQEVSCVATVGGTWMIPEAAIAAGDWSTITDLTRAAVAAATR